MAQSRGEFKWVREASMRGVRICSGAFALALSAAASTVREPAAALERVELRGVRVQRSLRGRVSALGRESGAELNRLTDNATAPVRWVQREVYATGASSAEEMERGVERMLERLGLPSRERIDRLTQEIESLSVRIDQELATLEQAKQ